MRAIALAVLLVGAGAQATSNFPDGVQAHLSLSYAPQCSLCHFNGVTNATTVTTPFGNSMRARGLVANSVTSLNSALDKLAADKVDSDGDGMSDIDELKAGRDPNVAQGGADGGTGGGPGGVPPPEYGCSAVSGAPLALLGLLAGLVMRRRRRA